MENHDLPENLKVVKLSAGDPKVAEQLKELNGDLNDRSDLDVVIDFSNVEIVNSSNISNLLILRGLLEERGRKLILYNVKTITKCIFVVAGLADFFVFLDNVQDVLKELQSEACTK